MKQIRFYIGMFTALLLGGLLLSSCAGTEMAEDGGGDTFQQSTRQGTDLLVTTFPPTPLTDFPEEAAGTPEPAAASATIGAVGDIMAIYTQIDGAFDQDTQAYDFTPSFTAFTELMRGVDLMCGNLETPLAGEGRGYSQRSYDESVYPRFNAPDALAQSLKDVGFDVLTTANNHCLDQASEGLKHTLDVLDAAGVAHTGTARSPEEAAKPLVYKVNGICIGIVAATVSVNNRERELTEEEQGYAVCRLDEGLDQVETAIRECRIQGAEYVVVFPHWDVELRNAPTEETRLLAQRLIALGADAVLGSHPHVVQAAEWISVETQNGRRTGIVVYSMGNFIAHMYPQPKNYGMFLRLTVVKTPDGTVTLDKAEYLPTVCVYRHEQGQAYEHSVLPAYGDPALIQPGFSLRARDVSAAKAAREYVINLVGTDVLSVMEDE